MTDISFILQESTGKALILEMCESVIDNFKERPDAIIAQKGRHIEHMM